jgi:hypothetical protein
MTRNHRRLHVWAWLLLGPLLIAGFLAGLFARPTSVNEQPPTTTSVRETAP